MIQTSCPGLKARGVDPCPPDRLPLEQLPVRDQTLGAVPPETVRAWAEGFQRTYTYYLWAEGAGSDNFLLSGVLGPPAIAESTLYNSEVGFIRRARDLGATLRLEPLHWTRITLVKVPENIRQAAVRHGYKPSDYGWIAMQVGPAKAEAVMADGSSQVLDSMAPGEASPILVFGELRNDPDLGPIWYQGGLFGCRGAEMEAVCRAA
jgi:hypothetical protein